MRKFVRAHFLGSRYHIVITNGVESIHRVLNDAREYPIMISFDFIQRKTFEWYNRHHIIVTTIKTLETPLTITTKEIVKEIFIEALRMNVFQLNWFK